MKLLHVTPSFYPATFWGGPIWSTKAICDGLHAHGADLRVLTTDAASPQRGDRVEPAALPYRVHYARRVAGHSIAPGLFARLPAAVAWADVVHLTGTYNAPTLPVLALCRALRRPLVWSPRGALQATEDWAEAPRKPQKHLFEKAAQLLRPDATVLHVTAPSEAAQSCKRLAGIETAVIANAVDIPDLPRARPERGGVLRLLFLGRLHPKKGIGLLFSAMEALGTDVRLDVYGTGDPAYVALLRDHARAAGGRITLHGQVSGAAKTAAFRRADMFALPSHSENFGIAIAEALAHGVPVVTTTKTPWQGLDAQGCGRCIDLETDDLAATIRAFATQDLRAAGAAGRAWMQRDFSPQAMVAEFAALYARIGPSGQGRMVAT